LFCHKTTLLRLLVPEDKGTTINGNITTYRANDTASYPRLLKPPLPKHREENQLDATSRTAGYVSGVRETARAASLTPDT